MVFHAATYSVKTKSHIVSSLIHSHQSIKYSEIPKRKKKSMALSYSSPVTYACNILVLYYSPGTNLKDIEDYVVHGQSREGSILYKTLVQLPVLEVVSFDHPTAVR